MDPKITFFFSLVNIICFTFWHILTNVSLGTVGDVTAHPTSAALWMQSEALVLVACEPQKEKWQKRRYLPLSGTQSVSGMGKEEIREKKGTGFTLSVNKDSAILSLERKPFGKLGKKKRKRKS